MSKEQSWNSKALLADPRGCTGHYTPHHASARWKEQHIYCFVHVSGSAAENLRFLLKVALKLDHGVKVALQPGEADDSAMAQ